MREYGVRRAGGHIEPKISAHVAVREVEWRQNERGERGVWLVEREVTDWQKSSFGQPDPEATVWIATCRDCRKQVQLREGDRWQHQCPRAVPGLPPVVTFQRMVFHPAELSNPQPQVDPET